MLSTWLGTAAGPPLTQCGVAPREVDGRARRRRTRTAASGSGLALPETVGVRLLDLDIPWLRRLVKRRTVRLIRSRARPRAAVLSVWECDGVTMDAAEGVTCDFFVSYTQADRDWAEWIAWWLEEDGYRVLIQAWDMVAGNNWVSRMDRGVQQAARMVAVLSPDYLSSVYGGAEWQAVWAGDPQGQQRKLITVRIRGERPAGLLRGAVGIDLVGLSEVAARRRLRDEIAAVVQGRAKPGSRPPFPRAMPAEPRFPGTTPEVFTVAGRNPHFTGRASDLDVIRRGLSAGTVITVHGLGGVGKTQLVIEYAHRNTTAYDLVGWIDAEQPTLISSQFAALAEPLGLPLNFRLDDLDLDIAVRAVRVELRLRHRWLLIFDNAEDVTDIRPFLPGGAGHVLVTTRRGGFGYLGPVLDLDVFPRPDAITLLRRRAPALADDQAAVLAELLGDLPLALEQAAAYLDQTRMPPADYLHLLTTRAGVCMAGAG
jgi:hypothetical protein